MPDLQWPWQREDAHFLCAVIERAKHSDFFQAPHAIERIKKFRVARGEFGRLEISTTQVCALKRTGILLCKKMKAEPAPIGPGNFLRLAKEGNEQKEHEVGIHLRLQLEIAREFLRFYFAATGLELQRCVQRVIDFFHEHDERTNVSVVQSGTRIVAFELFDQPPRIINSDVQAVVCVAQERARELAQFTRGCAGQLAQVRAS